MSVAFTASNQFLNRGTNLPPPGSFTATMWVRITNDLNTFSTVIGFREGPGNTHYTAILTKVDGTSMSLWRKAGGATTILGTHVGAANTWYFVAFSCDYDTVNTNLKLYTGDVANARIGNFTVDSGSQAGNANAPNVMEIGAWNVGTLPMEGNVHALKIWDRVLTQAEISQEANRVLPVYTEDLNSFYPFYAGESTDSATLVDNAGLGSSLAQGGAGVTSTDDPPPIAWGFARARSGGTTIQDQGVAIPAAISGRGILTVATPDRSVRRVTLNRNISSFHQDENGKTVAALIDHARDAQRAIDDIYDRSLAVPEDDLDGDGFPRHGATCTALNGQYIHIFRPAPSDTSVLAVAHGLGKVPQGAFIVYDEGDNPPTPCIAGSWDRLIEDIPPADAQTIYFKYGSNTIEGDRTIFLLF